jgi:UDP-N-acetylglucosamine--N-acetylmuramyl-(pentapeptide) pyrophosphoryl-undecaprenol N-acetylglucosamine transferase
MEAELLPFIDDMSEAYAWADLVLCRAGALTISELTAAGVAALLVPYPYAVDDHQTLNARFLVNAGAAVLIPQSELSPQRLIELLKGFNDGRSLLLDYAKAARSLARPDATRDVVDICLHAAGVDKSPDAGVPPQ